MGWIIAVSIIGGLILLSIVVLSIPLDLAFRFEFYGKPEFNLRLAWFFGLLSRDIKPGKRKAKKPRPPRKFGLPRALRGIRSALEFGQIRDLLSQCLKLIQKMFGSFRVRELNVELYVGLDDPSDTFYLFTITEPMNRILNRFQPCSISIQPYFMEPLLEGYARGSARIYPVRLIPALFRFIFSQPVFKLVRKMVAARWKRNR